MRALTLLLLALGACPPPETDTGDEDLDGVPDEEDCAKDNAAIYPGAPEVCDGLDNDCDVVVDEGTTTTFYADADGDGYGTLAATTEACEAPNGYVTDATDCDDHVNAINPGASEVCDHVDNDCDGAADESDSADALTWFVDADEDEHGDPASPTTGCSAPDGAVAAADDCDDANPMVFPEASETCDGMDNDCDGQADEEVTLTWYLDGDGDGYGTDRTTVEACEAPPGFVTFPGDCDDAAIEANPGGFESCDGIDNDCDRNIDEDAVDASSWYLDSDHDGFGAAEPSIRACSAPEGYVETSDDCDDGSRYAYPGATEICDHLDNDCDGLVDDADPVVAGATAWYLDADSDGYGDSTSSVYACDTPAGRVADAKDCDDGDFSTNPSAAEACDGEDNDCDGLVDDKPVDVLTFFADMDGDGFGEPTSTVEACSATTGYVSNYIDCDDDDPTEPVVVDGSAGSTGGDGTLSSPLSTVQAGIDKATACVAVLPGTYYEGIDFHGAAVEVSSVDGPWVTILNGSGAGPVVSFQTGESAESVLRGFTVTNGVAVHGGGVFIDGASPVLVENIISYNMTMDGGSGGGIYINNSEAIVQDNIITANTAGPGGGDVGGGVAIRNSSPTLQGNVITDNLAGNGAGIWASENEYLLLLDNLLLSNWAGASTGSGGGAYLYNNRFLTVQGNLFCACRAAYGGAVYSYYTSVLSSWENNIFQENESAIQGGAAYLLYEYRVSLVNNTLVGNTAASEGGGLYLSNSYGELVNNVFAWTHTGDGVFFAEALYASEVYTDIFFNDWYGNFDADTGGFLEASRITGDGNITRDPGFVRWSEDGDCTNDDLRPMTGSPLIDAGYPSMFDEDGSLSDIGIYSSLVVDADGDGFILADDCDDGDASTYPDAPEDCDETDNDCDGGIDEDCPVEHCGTLSSSETWSRNSGGHLVTCDVYVQGSGRPVLTVDDAASVYFSPGTTLYVGWSHYGDLIADGAVFTSVTTIPAAGDWGGLYLGQYTSNSELTNSVVAYGGDDVGYPGNIVCSDCSATLTGNLLTDSQYYGIYATGTYDLSVWDNTFERNGSGDTFPPGL